MENDIDVCVACLYNDVCQDKIGACEYFAANMYHGDNYNDGLIYDRIIKENSIYYNNEEA